MTVAPMNLTPLKPGFQGTQQTIAEMQRLVTEAVLDARVRRTCEFIVRDTPGGDRIREARAIFEWVRRHLRYTRDPSQLELLTGPVELLKRISANGWAAGDCDDHAMLTAALGHAIRLPIVFVLVGQEPQVFEHVYAAMEISDRGLLALDTGVTHPTFGAHPRTPSFLVVDAMKGL